MSQSKQLNCQIHDEKIVMILLEENLEPSQRLLCQKCIDSKKSKEKMKSYENVISTILETKKTINQFLGQQKQKIQNLLDDAIEKLRQEVLKEVDKIKKILESWMQKLEEEANIQSNKNILLDFDLTIINMNNIYEIEQNAIQQLCNINKPWLCQIQEFIQKFKEFSNYQTLKENLQLENNKEEQNLYQNNDDKQNLQTNLQQEVQISEINQMCQDDNCYAIAINRTGTLIASGCSNKITMWNLINNSMQEITTLDNHKAYVNCLIFSQQSDNFISSSYDKTIIMWINKQGQTWFKCQEVQESVYCMVMNNDETLLFTGGDTKIIIWDISFKNKLLSIKERLDGHLDKIHSISLNEQNNLLVSCSSDKSIIVWQKNLKKSYSFHQIIQNCDILSYKLCFISNIEFILVTAEQNDEDYLYFFEQQENQYFSQNQTKSIKLNLSDNCHDRPLFPIVFNKKYNIIAVRQKWNLYLIKIVEGGQLKRIYEKEFETPYIYGTMSQDGNTIITWDQSSKQYSVLQVKV